MSTYGFDPNKSKSKVEVYPKADVYSKTQVYAKSETYSKTEVYNKTEADGKFLTQTAGAPKNHASTSSTYGLATASNYGHVKTTTSTSAPTGSQDGIALAGSMGYMLKKYTDDNISSLRASIRLPVGVVIGSATVSADNPSAFAQAMGYGTWTYIGTAYYNPSGSSTRTSVNYFRRVS